MFFHFRLFSCYTGVHDHDVLCGRGAFVNGHVGNQRLRKLAMERKAQFDEGSYTEKRALVSQVFARESRFGISFYFAHSIVSNRS